MLRKIAIFSLLILIMGLTACSNNRLSVYDRTVNEGSICQGNPFLNKYHCSFDEVQQVAKRGDPDAQYTLGYLYYYGIGTVQDETASVLWMQKAAKQGQKQAVEALKILNQPVTPKRQVSSSRQKESGKTTASLKTCESSSQGYTIQLMGSYHRSNLEQFVQMKSLSNQTSIYVKQLNSEPWYVLTYRYYSSRQAANNAKALLPNDLKMENPWVRSCASLK